jgi:hypothetical protein
MCSEYEPDRRVRDDRSRRKKRSGACSSATAP